MIIKLTDTSKTISMETIMFGSDGSNWNEDWFLEMIGFPSEKFDEDGCLLLTAAEYESYKIIAQDYAANALPDGEGIFFDEEIIK